ncbi:hypothetical protein KC331_g7840 [Hortaea werneckii]|nr:hypothetical protein KC331_g7840 [Hortaea werneckii]KAI7713820.1 hypothetical protein KC353_g7263 [Hortaea werneckii]
MHSASTLSAIAAAASATETTSTTSTALAGDPAVIAGSSSSGSSSVFSGTSFAAGFAPGIFVGALLCGALFFYLLRKKTRQPNKTYVDNEKGQLSSDTLTDLGTLSARPTMHGRSISGPVAEASAGHRTEFLRTTPPQHKTYTGPESQCGYSVEVTGPREPTTPCPTASRNALGTPYTPSNHYKDAMSRVTGRVNGEDNGVTSHQDPAKRETTFSSMMERAGLMKHDLVVNRDNSRS